MCEINDTVPASTPLHCENLSKANKRQQTALINCELTGQLYAIIAGNQD